MSSLSLIIPTRRVGQVLDHCLASLQGEYDELIVVDQLWDNLAQKINFGLRQATKDYLVVSNDDITLQQGHLEELCEPGQVISPALSSGADKTFHAHMFCLPRSVYEAVGPMCEDYDGFYWDDSDYWMKLLTAGYSPTLSPKVMIQHDHPATTLQTLEKAGRLQHNRDLFIAKWGVQALALVEVV